MIPSLRLRQDINKPEHVPVFWACYLAFGTTSFIFIVRTMVINDWGIEFALNETQKGEILGAGIWPVAISIVLCSMVIDDIGYGTSMAFGFLCQVASGVVLLFAEGYWGLYIGSVLVALGHGAVQAVSDATVATMFKKNKAKWLTIFHSAWPIGMVVGGGLNNMVAGAGLGWEWSIALLFVPILAYGIAMLGKTFPVHERILAGVSYREMLRVSGVAGMFIVFLLVVGELCRVFQLAPYVAPLLSIVLAVGYWIYLRSFGQPVFIVLLLLMIPLSTTEVSTNSWITALLEKEMAQLSVNSSWILIYMSCIMVVLRLCAGPIVKLFSPIGVLAISSAMAALGLVAFSQLGGAGLFVAATLFGIGITFLWPAMLGITAEQFPKGGALSLNMITAVGQLSAGILGAALLGYMQDTNIEKTLLRDQPALHAQVVIEKQSVVGGYRTVDPERVAGLAQEQKLVIDNIRGQAQKTALKQEAALPLIMLVCYLLLLVHFRRQGGYREVSIHRE